MIVAWPKSIDAVKSTLERLLPAAIGYGALMRVAYVLAAVANLLVLTRLMTLEGFGLYALVFAGLQLIWTIVLGGARTFVVREVSAGLQNQAFGAVRGLSRRGWQLVCGYLCLSAVLAVACIVAFHATGSPFWFVALMGVPLVFLVPAASMLESFTRGFGAVLRGQVGEFLIRPYAQLVLLIAILGWGVDVEMAPVYAMGAMVLGATFAFGGAIYFYFQTRPVSVKLASPQLKDRFWFQGALNFSYVSWLHSAGLHLPVLLLGAMVDESEAGLFRAAFQLATLVQIGVALIETSYGPAFGRLAAAQDMLGMQQLATRLCRISLVIAAPALCVFVILPDFIITILLGEGFKGAAPVLAILALGQGCYAVSGAIGVLALSVQREVFTAWALLGSLCMNLILCAALMPSYGAVGAAAAVSISAFAWNAVMIWDVASTRRVLSLPFGAA